MFTHYKNDSIRKLVIGFGSLFNGVKLEQYAENNTTRLITVPLTYSPKEKFIKRLTEPSSISDKTRIQISLPRMSFELVGLVYDPTRKLNKGLRQKRHDSESNTTSLSYSEVPYNFLFSVNVYTRNLEENLQIMEQILPYFSPEFVVTMKMNDIQQKVDVPISIVNTQLTQEYEGDFSTRRFIVSTYQFLAKSYIFGRIDTGYQIENVDMNIFGSIDSAGITLTSFGLTG
jgi:hypothetical protein